VDSWADFLDPHFGNGGACNLTGTYSDEYGYSHGLMLPRNVITDFRAFLRSQGLIGRSYCIGVEYHPTTHRAILHFHAMISGDFTDQDLDNLQAMFTATRGWAKAKPVTDRHGCARYAAKHLLKQGAADNFAFFVPGHVYGSRTERRLAMRGESR
jgi:hypothetical protein